MVGHAMRGMLGVLGATVMRDDGSISTVTTLIPRFVLLPILKRSALI